MLGRVAEASRGVCHPGQLTILPETKHMAPTDWSRFEAAIDAMNAQKRQTREQIREAIKGASVPLPPALVQELTRLSHDEVLDVLRDHRGFVLHERLASYRTTLQVFETSVEDLLRVIQNFDDLSRSGRLFHSGAEDEFNGIERSIQKELFAVANAADVLKNVASYRLQTQINIAGYHDRLVQHFGEDGLHDFIIGLRVIIHHIFMIKAGWQVRHDFRAGTTTATFKIDKTNIEKAMLDKMSAAGRKFFSTLPNDIDLRVLFTEYRRRVTDFHAWFAEEIEASLPVEVRDYEFCVKESSRAATRLYWKAMIKNWLNWSPPPNPYDHLDRYLTSKQLAHVYALPMKSKAQVDKVIEFVDADDACDDELRILAYELFNRAADKQQATHKSAASESKLFRLLWLRLALVIRRIFSFAGRRNP